jgi:hypothetical protein
MRMRCQALAGYRGKVVRRSKSHYLWGIPNITVIASGYQSVTTESCTRHNSPTRLVFLDLSDCKP